MNFRRGWVCVFLITLTTINYADRVALSVAATPIRTEFGLSQVQMGYLLSSFLWTYVLCLVPVGLLVDRFGGKMVNGVGLLLWSVATILTGFAPGFLFMMGSRMVMGMGESTSWPASNRVIREWFPASERGLANAIFGAGATVGPALGSVAIAFLVGSFGWRVGFVIAGTVGFVWLLAWVLLFDQPERAWWLGAAERARILRERDGAPGGGSGGGSSLRWLLRQRSVWGLFFTQGSEVYGSYMLLTWLPSYLQQAKGLSLVDAGMVTAVPFALASVFGVGLGWVSDRLLSAEAVAAGRRRSMIAVMLLGVALIVAVPVIDRLWVIVVLLALVRAFALAGSALNFALVTDLVRSRTDVGKVTAITVMGGNSFGMLAPIVTGYVIALTGSFDRAFVVAGLLPLAGAAASFCMTRRPIEAGPGS
ncbi:MAG TPA: MFS transporter [Rhodopila sp.]|nr:MFS transporter [Rhodopila sp.]